jgi:RNA polymerase sigma factor (sigma-70 family)
MKEYRLEVKIKNNLIMDKIEKAGYKSVNDFCYSNNLAPSVIGNYINLKRNPISPAGEYRKAVQDLAEKLNCSPDELFTEEQKYNFLKENKKTILVNEAEVKFALENLNSKDPITYLETEQRDDLLHQSLSELTDREQKVITMLYGLDGLPARTLTEVGKEFDVTTERVRQIHQKALRKLHHPDRGIAKYMKEDSDDRDDREM